MGASDPHRPGGPDAAETTPPGRPDEWTDGKERIQGITVRTWPALPGDARDLRLGTAAVTTQHAGAGDGAIAELVGAVLRGTLDAPAARRDVRDLTLAFPPYPAPDS
ncbi:hypothetical protein [Streptomyces sp. TS71-3]|uniref:hypothetical protein n=1 Tax=Streptomyces sp. TS71-3 TaxID=2733862 RepID=UPI001BB34A75|nr:hypothetical protein [Streptomyces sp. TS71-3]